MKLSLLAECKLLVTWRRQAIF